MKDCLKFSPGIVIAKYELPHFFPIKSILIRYVFFPKNLPNGGNCNAMGLGKLVCNSVGIHNIDA
jgi:hypothetical protein